jgi:hypothetical protein
MRRFYTPDFLLFLTTKTDYDEHLCMETDDFLKNIDGTSDLHSLHEKEFFED